MKENIVGLNEHAINHYVENLKNVILIVETFFTFC
jgi:hypothetical protein